VRLMTIHQAKGLEFPIVILPDLAAVTGGAARPVAEWDANLGCVVRPPADEETPPFPEFGWKLRQSPTELEEWHQDLRILYVRCTRARDYLILSASLAQMFQPTNASMITLAERFELETGRYLAEDVSAERVPRVKVFGER